MAKAWTCKDHGSFLQTALDEVTAAAPSLTRGLGFTARYACPECVAKGGDGFMTPATKREIAVLEMRLRSNAAQHAA